MAKRMVKKALAAAVVAGLAAQSAEAVYVNPDGHGSALIYQYYTVQNVGGTPQDTLISVVNTTNVSKAVKVRFREGKASQEVLDFLVLLSPYDVWTAAVTANGSSETSGAKIITADTSCVWPRAIGGVVPGSGSGVAFKNLAYVGDAAKDNAIARTREGYIELLEAATIVKDSDLDVAITHVNGVPDSCADAIDILNEVDGDVAELSSADVTGPNGGLTGKASIVNVLGGSEIGYNAVALGAFRTPDSGVMSTAFGTVTGALRDADPVTTVFGRNVSRSPLDPTSTSGVGGALSALHVGWNEDGYSVAGGALAVTAALMRDSVMNEYSIGAFSKANTDWVMTFPTKSYFVPSDGSAPSAPFTQKLTPSGACEPFQFEYWDREERQVKITEEYDFSPLPEVEKEILTACWESTILTFYTQDTPQAHQPGAGGAAITASGVLGSKNISGIPLAATYDFGWARLTFGELDDEGVDLVKPSLVANGQCSLVDTDTFSRAGTPAGGAPLRYADDCPDNPTFYGLPVVGFMVQSFNNGTLTCGAQACKSSYGQAFNHNYTHSYDFAAFRNN